MTARRTVSATLAAGVVLTCAVATAPGASAASPLVSQATGRFLSGTANGTSFDKIAALNGEQAVNNGGKAVVHQHDLSGSVLGQQLPKLPGGVQLPGGGVLTLGAVNQYARANPNGSSHAASGAVTNSGLIGIGGGGAPQSDATLDLTGSANPLAILGGLKVSIGALAATAEQAKGKNGAQSGDYQIASLKLVLTSPGLAGAVKQLTGGTGKLPGLSDLISQLGGAGLPIGNSRAVATSDPTAPLTGALRSLGDVNVGNGAIAGSLTDGTLTIDVAKLLKALFNLDLNNLPPNTHLMRYVAKALPQALGNGLTQLQEQLSTVFDQLSLQTTTSNLLTTSSTPAQADSALATLLDPLTKALRDGSSGLSDTLFVPMAKQLESAVDPIVNVQQHEAGTFAQSALSIALGGGAAVLNLASASVGPNAGPRPAPATHSAAAPPPPKSPHHPTGSLPNTGADVWLTKVALFGLLGLCLGGALFGATIGVRKMGKYTA